MRTTVLALLMAACCCAGSKPSTTTLSADRTTVYYGEYIVFMATVTGLKATPTGTVDFREGSTSIGTATLVSGTAILNINSLNAGPHIITAYYSGDSLFQASSSSAYGVIVNPDNVAITITDSRNPTTFGEPASIDVVVSAVSPGVGVPTGPITWYFNNKTSVAFGELDASGHTTLDLTSFGAGTFEYTLQFSGNSNFNGVTSQSRTHTINKASTSLSITPSVNPDTVGVSESVAFTVSSVPPCTLPPTGSMVYDDGIMGPATLDLSSSHTGPTSSGATRVRTFGWPAGNNALKLSYSGDANFSGASTVQTTLVVNKAPTAIVLASSANPAPAGQSVTFSATVAATTNSALSVPLTGSELVTLKDGSTTLGIATLVNRTANFTTSSLTAGTHSITAVYDGDSSFLTSTSSALSQTVSSNISPTTTTLTSSPNPASAGQSVKFIATVTSSGSGTPTGTMTFSDGSATLGSSSLSQGKATFTTSALPAGTHQITAAYNGDSSFAASTSATLAQTVNGESSSKTTTTSLTATPNPATAGQPVTLTATVAVIQNGAATASASSASSAPTGSVAFLDGGTVLHTSSLSQGQAAYTTSSLSAGAHAITAVYSGDSSFDGSTSDPLALTVAGGSQSGVTAALAHFAAGDTWTTGIFVVNTGNQGAHFSIAFFDDAGNAATVPFSDGPKSTLTATVPPNGSAYYEASDPRGALVAGWARVTSDPAIVVQALFRNDAVGSYYEAAVPSSFGSREFVIPFDATTFDATGAQFYTGFAVANMDDSVASVACIARDSDGVIIPNAVAVPALSPYGHWANYLFPALAGKRGLIDCSANANIAATALRFIGANAFSSLPVLNDPASFAGAPHRALAHIAAGDTWTTGFFVLNTGNSAAHFSMSFHDDGGSALSVPLSGGPTSTLSGVVAAHGSAYYEAADPRAPLAAGWTQIAADPSIVVQALFRDNSHGIYYEAAVESSSGSKEFLLPFDATIFSATEQSFFTGFAIANLDGTTANIACTARDSDGVVIPNGVPVPALTPYGHWANYLFPALTGKRGTIDCVSSTNVAATALRFIGANAFSSLPVITK